MANTIDVDGARQAGWSDAEIAQYAQQNGIDPASLKLEQTQALLRSGNTPPAQSFQNDPTQGMSRWDTLMAGAGRGLVHTGREIGNMVGLIPDSTLADEKQTDAPLLNNPVGASGNALGEAAATAPLGMGASAALSNAGKLGAALAANPISNAAVQGAVQGAAVSDPGQRAQNATIGAATGAGLGTGGAIASKLVNGLTRTPEAQLLLDKGIDLTPGQLNPTGPINQIEQMSEHIPGVGSLVKNAQENAEHQWQAKVIQQGAAPGAPPIQANGNIHDMLQQAYDSYQPLYDQAKGFPVKAGVVQGNITTKLPYLFDQAAKAPGTTADGQAAAKSFLDNQLTRLPANPTSTDLLQLRSNIRTAARTAKLSNDTIAGDKAQIFGLADDHVTSALNSQLPPQALAALQSADSKYGTYKIVENAVAASKDNVAGMTPQKVSQAVYNNTADPAYARGAGGPLRDMANAGTSTFQQVVPLNGASAATMAGAAGLSYLHPAVGAGLAGTQAGLTLLPAGRRLAAGTTAPQQATQKLVDALQGALPAPVRGAGGQLLMRGATGALMPVTQKQLPQALAAALMLSPPASAQPQH